MDGNEGEKRVSALLPISHRPFPIANQHFGTPTDFVRNFRNPYMKGSFVRGSQYVGRLRWQGDPFDVAGEITGLEGEIRD
jgi:hypothetical protein